MTCEIDTAAKREKLPQRPAPYFHKIAPGKALGFRTTSRTWIARLHKPGGDRQHHPIGHETDYDFDAALAAAITWFGDATNLAPSRLTVSFALSSYLTYQYDHHSETGYRSAKSFLDNHVRPQLGDRLIADLKTGDYIKWRDRTFKRLLHNSRESDPVRKDILARQTTIHIIKLFKAALNRAWEINPGLPQDQWKRLKYLPMPKGRGQARMIVLSEKKNEPRRLLNACESDQLRNIVAFMYLTGCRPGEAYEMRCGDYDRDRKEWDVAFSKTGPRTQTLPDAACELLERVTAGRQVDEHAFVRPDGQQWTTGRMQHPFKKAVTKAGLNPKTVTYTARHTVISRQLTAGVPALAVALNLGTSLKMLQENYAKFFTDADDRKMLERGALKLDLPSSKVVSLR
jgi:integrase